MKLLDLFCGAGGAAMGYHRAGFDEIVGVDIKPQPRYPFEFIQADAMTYPLDGFDAIHASPPCQRFSAIGALNTHKGMDQKRHPDLIGPTRERLQVAGVSYVIENVEGSTIENALMLCGSMFGMRLTGRGYLKRHRLFESNVWMWPPMACCHTRDAVGVFGHGASGVRNGVRVGGIGLEAAAAKEIMGIDWMTRDEVAQAIPPAYTEYIGRQLLGALDGT